jgi:hypothetical protein
MRKTSFAATLAACCISITLQSLDVRADQNDKDLIHLVPHGLGWLWKKLSGSQAQKGPELAPPPVASTPTLPLGTDLADIVRYDSDMLPDAKPILESMQPDSPFFAEWFGHGSFTQIALVQRAQRWRGPVAIQAAPLKSATERAYVVAAGMLSTSATPEITLRRFKVTLARPGQPEEGKVIRVESLASLPGAENDALLPEDVRSKPELRMDVPASRMIFKISAGLKLRVFILKDEEHGIRFTYPIGVGGIDQGLDSKIPNIGQNDANILTPTFEDARLDRATIWSHRNDQAHFRNEPFLRIMNGRTAHGAAGWTAIGFHITIMSDPDYASSAKAVHAGLKGADGRPLTVPGPEWLTRGFDSHACMRLRRNDLRFVHDLALASDKSRVIAVRVGLEAEPEHNRLVTQGQEAMTEYAAWPLEEIRYKRVQAFPAPLPAHQCTEADGPDGRPRFACRDNQDHLTIMEQMPKKPSDGPVSIYRLAGVSAEELDRLGKLNDLAEGADADPRIVPPPCPPGETCQEPELPNLAVPSELSAPPKDPRLNVAPVPVPGTQKTAATKPAVDL